MACRVGSIGKHRQDAQKGCSARPQRVRGRGVPLGYVEGLNDARTMHGKGRVSARLGGAGEKSDFFSILLKAKDIEDSDAHKDAVVGKRSECMSLHKREKGRDYNPGDDERHEHPDPECQIIVLLEDVP